MARTTTLNRAANIYRFKQRGFNLVESAIVLGIIGLVISGVWVAAGAVNNSVKANHMVSDIGSVLDRVSREIGARNVGTIAATDAAASVEFFFPKGYVAIGRTISNPTIPGVWMINVSQSSLSVGVHFAYDVDKTVTSFGSAAFVGRPSMPRGMCAKFLPDLFNQIMRLKRSDSTGSFGFTTDSGTVIFGLPVGVDTLPAASFDGLITICGRGFKGFIGPSNIYLR